MYAVIRTGNKQYRVAENDILTLERLAGKAGDEIRLDEVLMVGEANKPPIIGTPLVEGARVTAQVLAQLSGKKIDVIKFKRRKNYRRQFGHKQDLTKVKITAILADAKADTKTGAKKAKATPPETKTAKAGKTDKTSKPAATADKKTASKQSSKKE